MKQITIPFFSLKTLPENWTTRRDWPEGDGIYSVETEPNYFYVVTRDNVSFVTSVDWTVFRVTEVEAATNLPASFVLAAIAAANGHVLGAK